jgi:hypothetical protein
MRSDGYLNGLGAAGIYQLRKFPVTGQNGRILNSAALHKLQKLFSIRAGLR